MANQTSSLACRGLSMAEGLIASAVHPAPWIGWASASGTIQSSVLA